MQKIKLLFFLCVTMPVLGLAQTSQSNKFTINGTMPGANTKTDGYFIAANWHDASGAPTKKVVDIRDGKFTLEGTCSGFTMLSLERISLVNQNDAKSYSSFSQNIVFAEAGETKINCKNNPLSIEVIQGSAANKDYSALMSRAEPLYKQLDVLAKTLNDTTSNAASISKMHESEKKIVTQLSEDIFAPFIKTHPKSPVSIFALGLGYVALNPTPDKLPKVAELYNGLSDEIKHSGPGANFGEQLKQASESGKGPKGE